MPAINPDLLATVSPPIPSVQAWGRAYGGARGPLLNLCQAAPAHPPPEALLEALGEAGRDAGLCGYGPILGEAALREAYAADLRAAYGGACDAAQVAVTTGCNQAWYAVAAALAAPGEAVAVPTPWYFNHAMSLTMRGVEARPMPCRAEAGFLPDPDDLAPLLADGRVRALVLVTPNNPTGAVYPEALVARLAEICARRGLWLVLDETYRDVLPGGRGRAHGLFSGAWPEGVVHLTSFSKSLAVPGHRLGVAVMPPPLLPEVTKVLDCLQICANRAAQTAVARTLPSLGAWRAARRAEANARVGAVRAAFSRLAGWRLDQAGAYFAYVRHPFGEAPAWAVAEALARRHGLMVLPGPAFGGPGSHLRIAFANLPVEAVGALEARLRAAAAEDLAEAA